MSRVVIDAATLFHVVTRNLNPRTEHRLVAPQGIRSQALDLLFTGVREGNNDERSVDEAHERITRIKIRLLGDRVSRRVAWSIASEHGWDSILEAEHIALTRLQADAFCSVDTRLRGMAEGLVPLAPLETIAD